MKHQEENNNTLRSPEEIADHLRVTYVPTYLLAAASAMLLMAFIVWGILGSVSDKVYFSGVVFPGVVCPADGVLCRVVCDRACHLDIVLRHTQKDLCKNHHYFIYEIYMDCVSAAVVTSGPIHTRRTGGTLYKHIKNSQVAGLCNSFFGLNACTYSMLLYPYIL